MRSWLADIIRRATTDPISRIVANLLPGSVVFWATARALERVTGDPRATVADALAELSRGLPDDQKLLVLPILRNSPPSWQAIMAIRKALPGLHVYPKLEGEDETWP